MPEYHLGVEIEALLQPLRISHPLREKHALYYKKLAEALQAKGLKARANDLKTNTKYPDKYNKWWITRDGSLGTSEHLSKSMSPWWRLHASTPGIDTHLR